MNISIVGTNVIVLYGDEAAGRYSDLINRWSGMIPTTQWNSFQFILIGTKMPRPELNEDAISLVSNNNTRFYSMDGPVPDASSYHEIISDKIQQGYVHLHLVTDAGENTLSYEWLKNFIREALRNELTTKCLYYLHFGRTTEPQERGEIISMLEEFPGIAFFVTDTQESGGKVSIEDRWHAVELAMLMNSGANLPLNRNAFSFGYSSLNANGSELRILRESAACTALREELNKSIHSLNESGSYLQLLPQGARSVSDLRNWLEEKVKEQVRPPRSTAWRNAWITTRMNPDLPPMKALDRMKRFADMNFAANDEIVRMAKSMALEMERQVRLEMQEHAVTACLSPDPLLEIADGFRRMINEDPQPAACAYPKKPLKFLLGRGMEEYAEQCKRIVYARINEYIQEKNISAYAAEMTRAYERLADWVRNLHEDQTVGRHRMTAMEYLQERQRDLDGSDEGNALRLGQKYESYRNELSVMHPSLLTLTGGIRNVYYNENGAANVKAWDDLVTKAAANMEKKLPQSFKGDFFKVLGTEFSTAEDREKFFDEFLRNGPRMYRNLSAEESDGVPVLLADNRLMKQWAVNRNIYEVNTDNAENLTLYPLGSRTAVEYLQDTLVYFKGASRKDSGQNLFFDRAKDPQQPRRHGADWEAGSIFGRNDETESKAEPQKEESAEVGRKSVVRLVPDEKNEYRLYWPWNGNDQTAMVELFQAGERIGRVAVIPVHKYQKNGNNLNVSEEIMEGKMLPMGILSVTIRAANTDIYISNAMVQGRREVVRYKMNGGRMQLRPENRNIVEKLALMTIEQDGTRLYFPLYPSEGESLWLYEGLAINNGRIVPYGKQGTDHIYPVLVE